jgi:ubiquinone/menaquinone biosynthesis C-methylase UbiE
MNADDRAASSIAQVREYWNSHLNLTQFLDSKDIDADSENFYNAVERHIRGRHAYKEKLLRDFSTGCQGLKLLEVGCGLGIELASLGKLGFDVTGIDLAPAAVKLAGDHLRRLNINGRTLVQNVEHMEFPDESFDAVYSSGVLHHTPDIQRAIAEILRVLKPGGEILVILYHRRSWFYLLHKLTRINIEFGDEDAPIINAYTKKQVKSLFHGLRIARVDVEYYYPMPTTKRGFLPFLFNHLFITGSRIMPAVIMKPLGWHLLVTGVK